MSQDPLPDSLVKVLKRKVLHTLVVLSILLAVGVFSIFIRIGFHAGAGAGLLWAFAALVLGGIAGFLFAIPRAQARDNRVTDTNSYSGGKSAAKDGAPDEAQLTARGDVSSSASTGKDEDDLDVNTNLQDISDWLTKMIVGVGLVELKSVPRLVDRIGIYVGKSLELGMDALPPGKSLDSLQSTAAGIVIYFAGLGFLSGYLLTRMFLSPAFWLADRATKKGTADTRLIAIAAYEQTQRNADITQLNSEVNGAIEELAKPTEKRLPARIGQLIESLSSRRAEFPLDRRLYIVLGRLYRYKQPLGDYDSAIRVLGEFVEAKKKAGQRDKDLADALFNIACYYSLELGNEHKLEGKMDEKRCRNLEELGMEAIRESIAIQPLNIEDFKKDEDLKALRETKSGTQLLEEAERTKKEPVGEVNTQPVEEAKSQPVEEVNTQPVEEAKSQPVEEVNTQPVEEVKSQPVEEVKSQPVEEVKRTKDEPEI